MHKVQEINFCRRWMRLIEPLKDLEYQQEFWFDQDKEEISSYEETLDLFLSDYERTLAKNQFHEILDKRCCNLLEELFQKINTHETSTERYVKYSFEEALLGDPNWLVIVDLAKQNYVALERYIEEVKNEN